MADSTNQSSHPRSTMLEQWIKHCEEFSAWWDTHVEELAHEKNPRDVAEAGWLASRAPRESGERPGPSGDLPSDFQEGQWWLEKLDEMSARGDDNTKRAVATVRNLMRTAHAQAGYGIAASPAGAEGADA